MRSHILHPDYKFSFAIFFSSLGWAFVCDTVPAYASITGAAVPKTWVSTRRLKGPLSCQPFVWLLRRTLNAMSILAWSGMRRIPRVYDNRSSVSLILPNTMLRPIYSAAFFKCNLQIGVIKWVYRQDLYLSYLTLYFIDSDTLLVTLGYCAGCSSSLSSDTRTLHAPVMRETYIRCSLSHRWCGSTLSSFSSFSITHTYRW